MSQYDSLSQTVHAQATKTCASLWRGAGGVDERGVQDGSSMAAKMDAQASPDEPTWSTGRGMLKLAGVRLFWHWKGTHGWCVDSVGHSPRCVAVDQGLDATLPACSPLSPVSVGPQTFARPSWKPIRLRPPQTDQLIALWLPPCGRAPPSSCPRCPRWPTHAPFSSLHPSDSRLRLPD